jgi:hypothetical protein
MWVKKAHSFPSFTLFQFINPLTVNVSEPHLPLGFFVKIKQGRQYA